MSDLNKIIYTLVLLTIALVGVVVFWHNPLIVLIIVILLRTLDHFK